MPIDPRVPLAVDDIRRRLADTDSISLPRRELTKVWRHADALRLFESWKHDPPDERDAWAEMMKPLRARLSRGRAMELQLALEEAGIHCDPALGRLTSMTAVVRIYRKWRDPKSTAWSAAAS
ncbi:MULTISPECIES: hypothetical protein [Streptomyces]|uniref:Uncharacterized protein n=1 Tax=Streptomyces doudnae TaxID=3075536 RepID=A0ABD5EZZ6_9ACTN|nr:MULTISPECIES: hypothetical protein [unclassified Streptomyces]MDT0440151.1 hypothetical protein [Streptomyces sp. DSM 41981]MYQ68056.1 hypothetical protein [Streptomyces sp. SID4950]SCE42639.1 hypothetical protein GA0115242_136716 [Streptomyces sp. SolWspMP-5a-2]